MYYQGNWEKEYAVWTRFLFMVRGIKYKKLFSFDDVNEQIDFYEKSMNTYLWRCFIRLVSSKWFSRLFSKELAYYEVVPRGVDIGKFELECEKHSFSHFPAKKIIWPRSW